MRPAIVAVSCKCRERRQHVDLRQRQRGLPDAACLRGNRHAKLSQQPALDLHHLLLRVQHLRFVLFQLRSGEALGIDQRLLAFVIRGSVVQIGFRNLQVVAEDRVELHLQRTYAGALALPLFDLRDVLLAVAAQVAQLVQRSINSAADHAAIAHRQRRLVF